MQPNPKPQGVSHHFVGTWIDPAGRVAEWEGADPMAPEHSEYVEAVGTAQVSARILIVEDEHLVALDLQQSLERLGHVPVTVYTAEDAIERVAGSHFDLILMDIKLGGPLDGIDAARTIRSSLDLPIVYLTAYADNRTVDRARATEPYGYILKPFQERELKAVIDMALQRHRGDRKRSKMQQLQRFLADATARMSISLDYRSVARGIAELLVPYYADWCIIHLRETNDTIPAFTYARPEQSPEDPRDRLGTLIESVEQNGTSEILTQIVDGQQLETALGSALLPALTALGVRSLMCVPLRARDQILGSLTMASGSARPRYAGENLAFAEDLAWRLGLALDNALLYRKAERAIRMRDDVLAIVSHDLRTPLGTILLNTEVIAERPEVRAQADAINRSAQRMNRLIGDLLDASSINAGKLAIEPRTHAAADVVQEAVEIFRSQAGERKLALDVKVPDGDVTVVCDRDRILQVLCNLLGNAIKFTPAGGRIAIEVTPEGPSVRFTVSDSGRGIPAHQLARLFDRFWRGSTAANGAGLGLFIANGIVKAHGSSLAVESTPGTGTRFTFSLVAGARG